MVPARRRWPLSQYFLRRACAWPDLRYARVAGCCCRLHQQSHDHPHALRAAHAQRCASGQGSRQPGYSLRRARAARVCRLRRQGQGLRGTGSAVQGPLWPHGHPGRNAAPGMEPAGSHPRRRRDWPRAHTGRRPEATRRRPGTEKHRPLCAVGRWPLRLVRQWRTRRAGQRLPDGRQRLGSRRARQ